MRTNKKKVEIHVISHDTIALLIDQILRVVWLMTLVDTANLSLSVF